MNTLKVKDYMSKDVITINKDASIHDAIDKMLENNIHGLLILDDMGRIEGVVTTDDVLLLIDKSETGTDMVVEDFMTRGVMTIDPEDALKKALGIMVRNKVHRLPVVKDKKILGIITSNDIMRVYTQRNTK